jgi:OmcA/MtrC family decaheme c-type cytochrome
MNRFDGFTRWAWSILVVCTLAFALGGCSGDDGRDGVAGVDGADGTDGTDGTPGTGLEPVAAAKAESCATCHGDVGQDGHQAEYNKYTDASAYVLTIDSVSYAAGNLTMGFSIDHNGIPYIDVAGAAPSVDTIGFYVVQYDSATGTLSNSGGYFPSLDASAATSNGDGTYTLSQALAYDPTSFAGGAIVGKIGVGELDIEDKQYNPSAGKRVMMYDNLSTAAWPIGDIATYGSAANVDSCEACHGMPYRKHGNYDAVIADVPDFIYCKACHSDDRTGGHEDWQYMVDEPFNWATDAASTADYSYQAILMNDTHMSHAMEFPYPQSMANCATCHEGKLTQVLDNSNFTPETCMSCHPIQGIDAWPAEAYAQSHRAPAFDYLWQRGADLTFHDVENIPDCQQCHGAGVARAFDEYHNGYDDTIYDATGQRYADLYPVSIDQVTLAGNLLTINFSGDATIVPEVLVSLYGWDSKNFIIPSHARDANAAACPGRHGDGCQMEYVPESSGGGANPLFTEDAASVPGIWMVTLDMAAFQPVSTADIPTLIADGDVAIAEINIAPELELGGVDVVLKGAEMTFDLGGSLVVDEYFKGDNATVDIDKCNACHDALTSTFHAASGRVGDSIVVCKNCHNPTYAGSHLEMASRSIDSYVHAIHSFQPFDLDDVAAANDPVEDARTELHKHHVLPTFTAKDCEACHVAGTFDVPDQSKSMPGVLSASWDIADRNIGTVAEAVTGPASRACGGCHRVEWINEDMAGDLASFDAHTDAFGTYVENDDEDIILYGIIDKIMSMFE